MKIQVTLIRHGKTDGNTKGKYIGITNEPLCEQGIAQLKMLVKNRDIPQVEWCYTSGMIRAIETADICYKRLDYIVENKLNECDFGDFEGQTYEQLNGDIDYQRFLDSNGTTPFPNGEDPLEFRNRCITGFNNIVHSHKNGDKIAIVCHGGTIMSILEKITATHEFYKWQIENGRGYSFSYDTELMKAIDIKEI